MEMDPSYLVWWNRNGYSCDFLSMMWENEREREIEKNHIDLVDAVNSSLAAIKSNRMITMVCHPTDYVATDWQTETPTTRDSKNWLWHARNAVANTTNATARPCLFVLKLLLAGSAKGGDSKRIHEVIACFFSAQKVLWSKVFEFLCTCRTQHIIYQSLLRKEEGNDNILLFKIPAIQFIYWTTTARRTTLQIEQNGFRIDPLGIIVSFQFCAVLGCQETNDIPIVATPIPICLQRSHSKFQNALQHQRFHQKQLRSSPRTRKRKGEFVGKFQWMAFEYKPGQQLC